MTGKMPVFVKIEEYKDVLDILSVIKGKVSEAKNLLDELEDVKGREDAEIESWKVNLDDVEEKVRFVDETLFEPDL